MDGGRVEPRFVRVRAHRPDQTIGQSTEQRLLQPPLGNLPSIIPQRPFAQVGIRFLPNAQGVVPDDVQCEGFDDLLIRQIVKFLQDQSVQRNMQIFGRPTEAIVEMESHFLHRQMPAKHARPTPLQQPTASTVLREGVSDTREGRSSGLFGVLRQ